jgi:hypothetical protein
MPRYKVTRLDEVILIEFEGVVTTRRFSWLGAVDALLLRGHRSFVVSFENARLESIGDTRLVSAIAQDVLGHDGRVVFVPPPGRGGGAARVRSAARKSSVQAAQTVESAVAVLRGPGRPPGPEHS